MPGICSAYLQAAVMVLPLLTVVSWSGCHGGLQHAIETHPVFPDKINPLLSESFDDVNPGLTESPHDVHPPYIDSIDDVSLTPTESPDDVHPVFHESLKSIESSLSEPLYAVRPTLGVSLADVHSSLAEPQMSGQDITADINTSAQARENTGTKCRTDSSRMWRECSVIETKTETPQKEKSRIGRSKERSRRNEYHRTTDSKRKRADITRIRAAKTRQVRHISRLGTTTTQMGEIGVNKSTRGRAEAVRPGLEVVHISPTLGKLLQSSLLLSFVADRSLKLYCSYCRKASDIFQAAPEFFQ